VSDEGTFQDFEDGDGPDDNDAVEAFVVEVDAAVEAFGLPRPPETP
jgi:hypothetical protein